MGYTISEEPGAYPEKTLKPLKFSKKVVTFAGILRLY